MISTISPRVPPAEAASILGFSQKTLANWRSNGGGPRFIKINGGAVRYAVEELARWCDERTVTSTSEIAASNTRT